MSSFDDESFGNEVDPAAEFLAREQSQLADLADDLNVSQQNGFHSNGLTLEMNGMNGDGPENGVKIEEPTPVVKVERPEPEKIKKWREEQKKRLEEKDANEERKKIELRGTAEKELAEWYKQHKELIEKTKKANRTAEKQFVADKDKIEPGTEWERISKLCDFSVKTSKAGRDTTRMRSIILQLKQAPLKKAVK